MSRIPSLLLVCILCFSCTKDEVDETPPAEAHDLLLGGETTIFSTGPDAYTFPLANLDQAGISEHLLADGAFGQHFVTAPSPQFGGVGPIFNQNSCESCHIRNGRGDVPAFDGDANSGLLLRLSMPGVGANNGIVPVPGFGGQLQTKAIFGVTPEGQISKSEFTQIIEFLDGQSTTIQELQYTVIEPYMELPAEVLISPRVAPPVFGLGLLEAINESDILSQADESDADGDGISGKANMVWDVLQETMVLGRFGWKAEQPSAQQQAADAAHNDMGLTNHFFPTEGCDGQSNCEEGLQTGYDLGTEDLNLMAFYFQTLAVPAQRNASDVQVIRGQEIFDAANCSSCHSPSYTTGPHEIAALSSQHIRPYTDLLLHDMGEGLSDHRPTYSAEGNEWRTAPLWGIGLTQVVNPNATFLHDGRASTLEEAVLWHGGEAAASRDHYLELNESDRNALISFLKSL